MEEDEGKVFVWLRADEDDEGDVLAAFDMLDSGGGTADNELSNAAVDAA